MNINNLLSNAKEKRDVIELNTSEYRTSLGQLEKLEKKVNKYEGRTYDLRFSKWAGFVTNNGYRDVVEFEMVKNDNTWGSPYFIFVARNCKLDLDNRDITHVSGKIEEMKQRLNSGIKTNTERLAENNDQDYIDLYNALAPIREKYAKLDWDLIGGELRFL